MDMMQMPKLLAIIGVVAAALLVAGCTSFGDQTPETTPTAFGTPADSVSGSSTGSLTVLNEEMNESTIVVKLNSRFALELAENPSTGYAWNVTATDGLRVVSDEYVAPGSGTNAVGAAGTHRWDLEAIAEGLQQIDGVYRRSWENTTSDEKTFTVEIAVEP